ncbi:MAG TPA: adenylosuccinate synthetase, partial [Candidatus Eisenbacteria bacterium]|nr:adenylosuccinate synthetase [Candidatus Eisenbacteria bacterium]
GHGPFPSEMPAEEAERLRAAGEEYGAVTGRPRRCGWLDMPALRYAVRVNGLDELVITKLDVLDDFDEIKVAECYEVDGEALDRFPASTRSLERCKPFWRSFPGWKTSTEAVRRWDDLPEAARTYLEWVEDQAGIPITRISVGAGRDSELLRGVGVR